MKVKPLTWLLLLLFSSFQLGLLLSCNASQTGDLYGLVKSWKSKSRPSSEFRDEFPLYVGTQDGLMEDDKIQALPEQPEGVNFDQYSGYVTVDPEAGRALFYYFVESPQNSSTTPLLLYLTGGPGCSSLGYGAMQEVGPFRVNADGKTLFRNEYAWNNVANVIFLESPAGTGFSYSNTSGDTNGDSRTAEDNYIFLINWLERFPQYKTRDFFITGESYAGHFVPQLAYTILLHNNNTNGTVINLKGILLGNAWVDDQTGQVGMYDYYWTHALNSDETHAGIRRYCPFTSLDYPPKCAEYMNQSEREMGNIDVETIYAPVCNLSAPSPTTVNGFDPCSWTYVQSYMNLPEVQEAIHAKPTTTWETCRELNWTDRPANILPVIKQLRASGMRLWFYNGDADGLVPVTSTRYAINTLKLPVKTAWRAWYRNSEVGGYVVEYEGLVHTTIRGAGHTAPSYQPERSLTIITSFLLGTLPPPS